MTDRDARATGPGVDAGTISWRRTTDGVELFEEGNPDAWIRASFTAGVDPERRLLMVCPACGAVSGLRTPPGRASVCGECETVYEHARECDRRRK